MKHRNFKFTIVDVQFQPFQTKPKQIKNKWQVKWAEQSWSELSFSSFLHFHSHFSRIHCSIIIYRIPHSTDFLSLLLLEFLFLLSLSFSSFNALIDFSIIFNFSRIFSISIFLRSPHKFFVDRPLARLISLPHVESSSACSSSPSDFSDLWNLASAARNSNFTAFSGSGKIFRTAGTSAPTTLEQSKSCLPAFWLILGS